MPRDLVHFVVEEQARLLRLGIYGQVAAGGDVGGFFRTAIGARKRVDDARRSRRIGRAGRADVAESERLASLVDEERQVHPATGVDERSRAHIARRLEEVLAQWRAVPAGGRLTLTWPDELTVRNGGLPSRQRIR